ncbi:serine/threonine receptor-like kinase NFP [Fagus crenata]
MAISFNASQVLFLLTLFFSITNIIAQSPPNMGTNFSCSVDSASSCETYVAYFAMPPEYLDLENISDLFEANRSLIAKASNLVSQINQLFPGQLLLVPITCGCSIGNQYFSNITYQIKKVVQEFNPTLDPNLLQIGVEVIFPLFCKCPSKKQVENGIQNLITYVWQPTDDVLQVNAKFNASLADIVTENNYQNSSTAVGHPVLIPVSQLPTLSQSYPSQQYPPGRNHSKHLLLVVIISLVAAILIFLLTSLLVYARCFGQRKKTMIRIGSSLETSELIQMKEQSKSDNFEPKSKTAQSKLLPGATMNLNEHCRIGGSVYKATINRNVLAVKKIKEDVTEELKFLQKVNHANLVKLMGVSSDTEGNHFLVYEYAEKGSLDKWLHSSNQRLNIALDVANGLHYMHEHTQPTIVHREIRACNILLDSKFKAKIANFSMARSATNSVMPKVDVFAFGVVLLELLSGKKAMETKENGEVVMLWKDIRWILEVEENKEERLRKWIDPNLKSLYPIDGVLSLAALARACTLDKSSARPSMAEIVFSPSVFTQSCPETSEESWTSGILEGDEVTHVISPIKAR